MRNTWRLLPRTVNTRWPHPTACGHRLEDLPSFSGAEGRQPGKSRLRERLLLRGTPGPAPSAVWGSAPGSPLARGRGRLGSTSGGPCGATLLFFSDGRLVPLFPSPPHGTCGLSRERVLSLTRTRRNRETKAGNGRTWLRVPRGAAGCPHSRGAVKSTVSQNVLRGRCQRTRPRAAVLRHEQITWTVVAIVTSRQYGVYVAVEISCTLLKSRGGKEGFRGQANCRKGTSHNRLAFSVQFSVYSS